MLLCQLLNMNLFEPLVFRQHFPLLNLTLDEAGEKKLPLVYFDNGATTQKPQTVIDSYHQFYSQSNANVHRSSHYLSAKATADFEQARQLAQQLINANKVHEIIWTKGTTESINLVAQSYGRTTLQAGDEIVLSQSEHHANIVPWQLVAQQTGAIIKVLPLDDTGRIDVEQLSQVINKRTKIVSFAHISNVLGRINPVHEIIAQAKLVGAITLIDGAQAIAHLPVDVQSLGCDFYVYSAHKMYGPTGVGVLYGKEDLLDKMPPYQAGGEMISQVSFESGTRFNQLPFKFEAGTPNIAGVVAFAKAIEFLNANLNIPLIKHEATLLDYLMTRLSEVSEVKFIVKGKPDIPVVSFTLINHHNHDVATALDSVGIAVRSGHHCAMPLMEYLSITGCLRVSLAPYNTVKEIDYFIEQLKCILAKVLVKLPIDNTENSGSPQLVQASSNVHLVDETQSIIDLFSQVKGWDSRHRQIMLLSKKLNAMPENQRNEQTLIKGCESLAWLSCSEDEQGRYSFQAYSDAKVIRGLLVIILSAYENKQSQQIQQFDLDSYFNKLGLLQHLSPSRGNGVKAIVEKIKTMAFKV